MRMTYPQKEKLLNIVTHAVGIPLSLAALWLLVEKASAVGTAAHVVSVCIYATTMLLLYTASTLAHYYTEGEKNDLFVIFDHSAIFLYIAGSYTPIVLHVIAGPLGETLFRIIWGIALAGVVFKYFLAKRFRYASTLIYLLMGWLIVLGWDPMKEGMGWGGLALLATGGVLYTVGTVFFLWRICRYHHAVWHLFVLAGSACHFMSVYWFVLA